MKRLAYAAHAAAWAVLVLAGCSDPHKGEHCVSSHRELWYMTTQKIGNGVSVMTPVYHDVCDRWEKDQP